jgi:hypothetical protein
MSIICKNSVDGTRHFIPDDCVICPVCAEERSRAALREFQKRPLRLIAQGKSYLTTRLIDSVRHVQQFSAQRTFCNRKVESYHRRGTATFSAYVQANDRVCEHCKSEIATLASEDELCSA